MLRRLLVLIALLMLVGCSKTPEVKSLPLDEAHKHFVQLCKDDYLLDVKIKVFDNTLWVFMPFEEGFLSLTADSNGAFTSTKSSEVQSIRYLEGEFANGAFNFQYDIGLTRKYEQGMGTTYKYSSKFQKMNQNILQAVNRTYSQVVPEEDNVEGTPPDFIMIVFADVTNGIKIKTLAHLKDIQRAMVDFSFSEEYGRRSITYQPEGDQNLIGDHDGKSLEYKDFTWAEFITEQIIYRIQYKYTRSAFPPSLKTKEEILTVISDATRAYQFGDYEQIVLKDLNDESVITIQQPELPDHILQGEEKPGKYHTIKFNGLGKIESVEEE